MYFRMATSLSITKIDVFTKSIRAEDSAFPRVNSSRGPAISQVRHGSSKLTGEEARAAAQ